MTSRELMDKLSEDICNRSEFYEQFSVIGETKNKLKCIELLMEHYNCEFDEAREVMDYFIDGKPLPNPNLTPQQIAQANAQAQEWLNKPKCPTCGSLNVEKISTGKKVFGGAMFGLFSSDVRNTMHCKNCGYKW